MRYKIYATKDIFKKDSLIDEFKRFLESHQRTNEYTIELKIEDNLKDCVAVLTGNEKGQHQFKGFIYY